MLCSRRCLVGCRFMMCDHSGQADRAMRPVGVPDVLVQRAPFKQAGDHLRQRQLLPARKTRCENTLASRPHRTHLHMRLLACEGMGE